ncbi:tyrosine-type recombinase/integrase [Candidatus Poribacteria bacterium]|nr:tyrosine-type recombinase/integrase [Candidatus Poribacteria bacterium]
MKDITTREAMQILRSHEGMIDQFLSSLDIKKSSKETYRRSLRQFFSWLDSEDITRPQRQDILRYKDHLTQELSALTVSNYIVAVRRFFAFLEAEGKYPNIVANVKGAKSSRSFRKDTLTPSQLKAMLDVIDKDTLKGKRDFAIINLMLRTALRTIEVCRANIEDIRQEGGEALLYIQGKGRDIKDEFVLLTHDTLAPIRHYLATRGALDGSKPLFTSLSNRNEDSRLTTRSISRIVKERLRDIDIDDGRLTAHSLRHTAITLSLLSGASLQETQAMARHSNINTTMVYAHNINRISSAPERKIDAYLNECL